VRDALFRLDDDATCNATEPGSVPPPPNKFDLSCTIVRRATQPNAHDHTGNTTRERKEKKNDFFSFFFSFFTLTSTFNSHSHKLFLSLLTLSPSNKECNPGFFLPVGETQCAPCRGGTVALGGGVMISTWDAWPKATDAVSFSTRCAATGNRPYSPGTPKQCAGWSLASWNVRSGAIRGSEASILEATVNLVRAGSVSFSYFVSAEEGFDGLIFLVDQSTVDANATSAQLPLVSNTPQLANLTVPLSAGVHTLTWKYVKDFVTDRGQDMAYIKNVVIMGTAYADETCAACPSGTFSNGMQRSVCNLCPQDTIAAAAGSTFCTPCDPDTEFSYPGATVCETRALCTAADYVSTFSDCTNDPQFADGYSRRRTFAWLQPKVCNSLAGVPLPQSDKVACRVCPAGFRRAGGDPVCRACPAGTAGGGGASTVCNPCAVGEAAQRQFLLDSSFLAFPNEMSTQCIGEECASNGWRILSDGIGSGTGHGNVVQSVLTWDINVVSLQPGPYVEFVMALECPGRVLGDTCELEFSIIGNWTTTVTTSFTRTVRAELNTVGPRKLQWRFNKAYGAGSSNRTATEASRRARAVINSILIVGATIGGAPTCVKCGAGTVAPASADQCTICGAGTGPNAAMTACAPCVGDEYSPRAGAGCRKCPRGTNRLNATHCDDGGCQFKDGALTYNLAPLKSFKFYGPVSVDEHDYEINVCSTDHHESSDCVDAQNNTISAYACQVLDSGLGLSLGNEIGYAPLAASAPLNRGRGVTLKYTNGEVGCRRSESIRFPIGGVPRSADVHFLCDPDAGKGAPEPCVDGNLTTSQFSFSGNGVEPSPCQYCFQWRSLYGCPVCGADDMQQVFSECRFGMRRGFYKWRDDRQCYGGQLPPPTSVACTVSAVICPAGQRLPPGEAVCQSCPAGTSSLGNGTEYFSFDQTLDLFESPAPSSGKKRWTFDGPLLSSGDGTSEVKLTLFFITNGSLEFNYLLMGDDGTLTVMLENRTLLTARGAAGPQRFVRGGLKGDVTFTWRFENGRSSLVELADTHKAILYGLRVLGTDLSSPDCDACPRGAASLRANSTTCEPCGRNTYASRDGVDGIEAGATQCAPCKPDSYSYMSSFSCIKRDAACVTEGVHYDKVFGQCVDGQRTQSFRLLTEPITCVDRTQLNALPTTSVACQSLPECGIGKYITPNLTCEAVPVGFVPVFTRSYLLTKLRGGDDDDDDDDESASTDADGNEIDHNALPSGTLDALPLLGSSASVSTYCLNMDHVKAVCAGGWRARGSYAVDSGSHGDGWVDSLLVIRAANDTFIVGDVDGELEFTASFVDNGAIAGQLNSTAARAVLYVYYGDLLLLTVTKRGRYSAALPANVLPVASQVITFRYHQDRLEDTDKSDRRQRAVRVWDVEISSSVGLPSAIKACGDGFSSNGLLCRPCPAGKSSKMGGPCLACPNNTIAAQPGSLCTPCGLGSAPNPTATRCKSSCVFPVGNRTFDMSALVANESDTRVVRGFDTTFALSPCLAAAPCSSDKVLGPTNHVVESTLRGDACRVIGATQIFSLATAPEERNGTTVLITTGVNLDFVANVTPTKDCPSGARVTRIQFICSPSSGIGAPAFVDALGSDRCANTFLWRSTLGCRKCDENDYVTSRTPCANQRRRVSEVRVNVCNGPEVRNLEDSYCVDYEFPAWVIYTFFGIVAAIALCAGSICIYNRCLMSKYRALQEATANNTQMTLIDDDLSDDDNKPVAAKTPVTAAAKSGAAAPGKPAASPAKAKSGGDSTPVALESVASVAPPKKTAGGTTKKVRG
jgi:hypothetical protein